MQNEAFDRIRETNNRILEDQFKIIEDNNKYNSVITSLGFVFMITALTCTHEMINNYVLASIICALGISIATFVLFEMRKVFLHQQKSELEMQNLQKYKNKEIDIATLIDLNNKDYDIYDKFKKAQPKYFWISAIFGFGSGAILFIALFIEIIRTILSIK